MKIPLLPNRVGKRSGTNDNGHDTGYVLLGRFQNLGESNLLNLNQISVKIKKTVTAF